MVDSAGSSATSSPWSSSVTKLVGFGEKKGHRIIGISGQARGVGASMLSMELARAYADFGKPTLRIDASRLEIERNQVSVERDIPFDILAMAQKSNIGPLTLDLAEFAHLLPSGRSAYRKLFSAVAQKGYHVVVDLPPVRSAPGVAVPGFMVAGAACELVYLVCLAGVVTRSELADSVEICKINGVPLGGIVPNDWKITGSGLLG